MHKKFQVYRQLNDAQFDRVIDAVQITAGRDLLTKFPDLGKEYIEGTYVGAATLADKVGIDTIKHIITPAFDLGAIFKFENQPKKGISLASELLPPFVNFYAMSPRAPLASIADGLASAALVAYVFAWGCNLPAFEATQASGICMSAHIREATQPEKDSRAIYIRDIEDLETGSKATVLVRTVQSIAEQNGSLDDLFSRAKHLPTYRIEVKSKFVFI